MTTASLGWLIDATESADVAALSWEIDASGTTGDEVSWTLTLRQLLDFLNGAGQRAGILIEPERQLGVRIEIDSGSGLQEIDLGIITASLTIERDLSNTAGGDRLSFGVIGEEYSPWSSNLFRGRRHIRVTGLTAGGGVVDERIIFDGWTIAPSFNAGSRITTVECLDIGAQWANVPLEWSVADGHGLTRRELLVAWAEAYAIPLGDVSLGPLGDVPLVKARSWAEVPVLQAISEFLSPLGTEQAWSEDGRLDIWIYDASEPVARTLTPSDLCVENLTVIPPNTETPNTFSVSSQITRVLPDGLRTVETESIVYASYAPQVAVAKMATLDGVITATGSSQPAAAIQPVKRTLIRTTLRGQTPVIIETRSWSWYAPQVATRSIDPDGTLNSFPGFTTRAPTIWQFPDESWRRLESERFMLTGWTIDTTAFDVDGYQTVQTRRDYFWRFRRKAVGIIDSSGAETFNGVSRIRLTESGEGIDAEPSSPAEELFGGLTAWLLTASSSAPDALATALTPDREFTETFSRTADGHVDEVRTTQAEHGAGAIMSPTKEGAYVYGVEQKQYRELETETLAGGMSTRTQTYESVTPKLHIEITEDLIIGAGEQGAGDLPITEFRTVDQIPYVPTLPDLATESATLTVDAVDAVRVALNGEISDPIVNEYCETEEDLQFLAAVLRRERAAFEISLEEPIDWLLSNRWPLALTIPEIGATAVKLWPQSLQANLAHGSMRKARTLRYFPPEVA